MKLRDEQWTKEQMEMKKWINKLLNEQKSILDMFDGRTKILEEKGHFSLPVQKTTSMDERINTFDWFMNPYLWVHSAILKRLISLMLKILKYVDFY